MRTEGGWLHSSSIMGVVGAVAGTCSRAGCVLGPQDRRGSSARADLEATARSRVAGVLPMTMGGRADSGMGRRSCLKGLLPFKPPILVIYRERASPGPTPPMTNIQTLQRLTLPSAAPPGPPHRPARMASGPHIKPITH